AAGYGWQVVRNSWTGEQDYVKKAEGAHALDFAGWISEPVARDLFRYAAYDFDALVALAHSRDFKPTPFIVKLKGDVTSTIRPFDTANVVANREGSDAKLHSVPTRRTVRPRGRRMRPRDRRAPLPPRRNLRTH